MILSYKDYKQNNNESLDEYISYLDSSLQYMKNAIDSGKNVGLPDNLINFMINNYSKYSKIRIYFSSKFPIKTVDELKLEAEEKLLGDIETLLLNKKTIENLLRTNEKNYSKKLEQFHKDENIYLESFTKDFFNKNTSEKDLIEKWLLSNIKEKEFIKIVSGSIKEECARKNLNYSDDQINDFVLNMYSVIHGFQDILAISSSTDRVSIVKESLIDKSKKKIDGNLPEDLNLEDIISNIVNEDKLTNPFFLNLPTDIQDGLIKEKFSGPIMSKLANNRKKIANLQSTYEGQYDEEYTITKNELNKKYEMIDNKLNDLYAKKNTFYSTINNDEEMCKITDSINKLEFDLLNDEIDESIMLLDSYQKELEDLNKIIDNKALDIKKIESVLANGNIKSSNYNDQNCLKLQTLYKNELKINEQVKMFIKAQEDLMEIENRKDSLKRPNESELSDLKLDYQYNIDLINLDKVKIDYNKLSTKIVNDFNNHCDQVSDKIIIDDLDDLNDKYEKEFYYFDETKELLSKIIKNESWLDKYINKLKDLFYFKKDNDGFFDIKLSKEEKEFLYKFQNFVIIMLDKEYKKYNDLRVNNELECAPIELRDDLIKIVGKDNGLSKQSLTRYVDESKNELNNLVKRREVLTKKITTNEPIKKLNIPYVEDKNDLEIYKEVLNDVKETAKVVIKKK